MADLDKYSKDIERNFFVGYFGDTVQNIYDSGVGHRIDEIHSDLERVNKVFNRRSVKEVIEVINKIRNDDIVQESIFDDCIGGTIEFYFGEEDCVEEFLQMNEEKCMEDEKIHCLVLTNRLVATYNGFEQVYSSFANTEYYKKNYSQINNELMSHDLTKLGVVQNVLYNFIELMTSITDSQSTLSDVFKPYGLSNLSLKELKSLVELLQQHKKEKLGECIESILEEYSNKNNRYFTELIEKVFGKENITFNNFKLFLIENLYNQNHEEEDENESNDNDELIYNLLSVSMYEYELWYKYIARKFDRMNGREIIYHTYHGTKGLEYDNIIIVMRNNFGTQKDFFNEFFKNYHNQEGLQDKEKYEEAKNLLYVACSRAKKNLKVYYIGDIEEFKQVIEEIFGEAKEFKIRSEVLSL